MSLLVLTSASVGLNILLLFYIVYTRMRQLKRANELYEEVRKAVDQEKSIPTLYGAVHRINTAFDAEAMSIFEDEQIRTGKMDVPPLNGSGAKGRMSDES
jgi:hypothetical protein